MTYRNFRKVVRQARSAERLEARQKVQRGTHNLVLHVQGDRSTREIAALASKFEHWWEDLRRGRLPVYGSLLRFIDIAVASGARRETLMEIPRWIEWYLVDRLEERDGPDPTHPRSVKLVA